MRLTDTVTIDGMKSAPDSGGILIVNPGTTVAMTCFASGSPPPSLRFTRNGVALSSGGRYSIRTTDSGALSFTINNVQPSDIGVYVCTASNDAGADSSRIILDVTGVYSYP